MKYIDEIFSKINILPTSVKLAFLFLLSLSLLIVGWLARSTPYTTGNIEEYLIFHNITEFFSVIISLSIFGIGWYTYVYSKNKQVLFMSCAFISIGLFDLMHMLSYYGMPDFITPNSANKTAQIWIVSRLFLATSLLGSAFIYPDAPSRWITKRLMLPAAFAIPGIVFIGIIYYPSYLPAAFIEGMGVTPFMIYSKYMITALLAVALIAYWKRYSKTAEQVNLYFISALIISIFSGVAFMIHENAIDTYNMLGHVYNIIAFFLIFKGIFTLSVEYPFMNLSESTTELRFAREEAECTNNANSEFFTKISHELRTPMNVILGFSDLLKMKKYGELNEKQEHYVDNINRSGKHLMGIISNMLDHVNVESGKKLPLLIESFPVDKTIEETLNIVKEKATQKHVMIKKEIDHELDVISADKLRFKQILLNLLGNAIKYSKPEGGTVMIKANKVDGMAQFSIFDTGIGIREEEMSKLFSQLYLGNSGTGRKIGQTALGLALMKQLVEMHGGKIWAQSKYGEGSVFTFTLPLKSFVNEIK